MQIEILQFFPSKRKDRKDFLGFFSIRLVEADLQIKGIGVFKRGQKVFVKIPHAVGVHQETSKRVIYPYVSFMKKEKHKNFIKSLNETCCNYLKSNHLEEK